MAGFSTRMIDSKTLTTGSSVMDPNQVVDVGAFRTLGLHMRVVKVGTQGTLWLEHSASKEPSSFKLLAGTSTDLDTIANEPIEVGWFLRYVRWAASGVAGDPVVVLDLVAKE